MSLKSFVKNDLWRVNYVYPFAKKHLADEKGKADLAITSQGRTIYELASMGVPAVVMAQNPREAEHVFAGIQNGFINLGIGNETDDCHKDRAVAYGHPQCTP